MRRGTRRLIALLVVLVVCGAGVLAFSRTPIGIAVFKSKEHFVPCESDARVLYEPGAEERGEAVAAFLPEAMAQIEREQLLPFKKPFSVYVCDSQESLNEYMGAPAENTASGVKVLNDVFLAPKAFSPSHCDPYTAVLMHELSHLHLYQRLGHLRSLRELPAWFQEGLATMVSGGGGGWVSDVDALDAILSGERFTPDERGGRFRLRRASDYGVGTYMFYKQSELFVTYMRESDPEGFRDFVLALQLRDWNSFSSVFTGSFGTDVDGMWKRFVEHVCTTRGGDSA